MKNSEELIGLILHDISKPISMLRSLIEISKRPDLDEKKKEEIMKQIEEFVEMANSEIRSFRTIYELSFRSFRSHIVRNVPDVLFSHILKQISNGVRRNDAIINFQNTLAKDVFILVDSEQFITAITNVLQNSMQYTKEKPTISISISQSDNTLNIQIDDFGFGFDESDIKHIFESGWSKGYGRGFGLWVTKNLLQQNNLDIQLISKRNPTSFLISGSIITK